MKKKIKQIITTISMMLMVIKTKVLASGVFAIQSTKLFTGTQRFANDATTALLYILPIISTALFVFCQIMKNTAEQDEQRMWKKRQIAIIVGLIIGMTASGLINAISGYYQ